MSTQRTLGLAVLLVARAVIAQPQAEFVPVTDRVLQNPDPADWLMWRRTLDTWGFSPLTEVNRKNVGSLRMVWTRALGPGIQEGTPLVYRGVMYFPNPSDLVQAINAASGDLLWEYRRSLPSDLGEYFPVPSINRRHELRRLSLRARRAQRPAAMGDEAIRLSAWRPANVGPDRRKR